jgi:hypothetical protein
MCLRPGLMTFVLVLLATAGRLVGQEVGFARDVLPLLSDRCFPCHGPDAAARKADLRLDRSETLAQFAAELVARIGSEDENERMPPADSHLRLSAQEIATLAAWVEQGAKWEVHWAFAEVQPVDSPALIETGWCRTPIDRFVLHVLRTHGREPAAEADRRRLARRVSLDLTGLPPDEALLERHLAAPSQQAYEQLVDALLASPHYGERWRAGWSIAVGVSCR